MLEANRAGYSERVVLHERPDEAPVFEFPLEVSDGLSVALTRTGRLLIRDRDGLVASADPAVMWGDETDRRSGEATESAPVDTALVQEAGRPVLQVAPDPAFLADPDVTLPITVDPSVTLEVTKDTRVQSNIANTSKFGDGELNAGTYNGSIKDRSFIKFGVGSLRDQQVITAKVELFNHHSYSCDPRRVEVRRLFSEFDSSTVWSNQPGFSDKVWGAATFSHGYSSSCPDKWAAIDITPLAQEWADGGGTEGIAVVTSETATLAWKRFRSSESGRPPRLVVTYNGRPSVPTDRAPLGSEWLDTLRPEFSARYCDPDGGRGRLEFEIERVIDDRRITQGSATGLDSCSRGSFRVPADTLEQRVAYRWRVRAHDGSLASEWTGWELFRGDTLGPERPDVSSASHPNPSTPSRESTFTATWPVPDDANGSGADRYRVSLNKQAVHEPNGIQTARSFSRELNEPGTYYFHVQAVDLVGNRGAITHRKLIYDPQWPSRLPGAPTAVTATGGGQTATVRWGPPSDYGGDGVYIRRYDVRAYDQTVPGGTPPLRSVTCTSRNCTLRTSFTGLSEGHTYIFKVIAHNKLGGGPAGESPPTTLLAAPDISKTVTHGEDFADSVLSRGEALDYTITVHNPHPSATPVVVTDELPTGLSVARNGVLFNGEICDDQADASGPACVLDAAGRLDVGEFTLAPGATATIDVRAVATALDLGRACRVLDNTATARVVNTAIESASDSVAVTVCDVGLGMEGWWTFVDEEVGPQAAASVNVGNGNLVLQATDSTPGPGPRAAVLRPAAHVQLAADHRAAAAGLDRRRLAAQRRPVRRPRR